MLKTTLKAFAFHVIILIIVFIAHYNTPQKTSKPSKINIQTIKIKPVEIKKIDSATPVATKTQTKPKSPPKDKPEPNTQPEDRRKELAKKLNQHIKEIKNNNTSKTVSQQSKPTLSKIDSLMINNNESLPISVNSSYKDIIISRLQESLVLPVFGTVELSLTINAKGRIVGFEILNSENKQNEDYVKSALNTLSFPPFDKSFTSQEQCIFSILLSNNI